LKKLALKKLLDQKNEVFLSEIKTAFSSLEGMVPQIGYNILHASERFGNICIYIYVCICMYVHIYIWIRR
jgi:hypothetical protein